MRHLPSCNWLYLSTLATLKEFASIKVAFSVTVVFYSNLLKWFVVKLLLIGFVGIEEHRFPVPKAVDCNRQCVVISPVHG